jgi:predicted metal-binding protein
MSKEVKETVRSYPAPWKGELLLICRKCQKKLKHHGQKNGVSKLSRALKKRFRHDENAATLHVLQVPCLKMCPKGGVTVCTQRQLARRECSIVRSNADVDALYRQHRGSTLDHVQGEAG